MRTIFEVRVEHGNVRQEVHSSAIATIIIQVFRRHDRIHVHLSVRNCGMLGRIGRGAGGRPGEDVSLVGSGKIKAVDLRPVPPRPVFLGHRVPGRTRGVFPERRRRGGPGGARRHAVRLRRIARPRCAVPGRVRAGASGSRHAAIDQLQEGSSRTWPSGEAQEPWLLGLGWTVAE